MPHSKHSDKCSVCLRSSAVEQGFCKAQVASSNLVRGSSGISSVVERHPSKLNVSGSNPLFRSREISSAVELFVYTESVTGSNPVSPMCQEVKCKTMIIIRCKCCNKEVASTDGRSVSCGCPNMATVHGDKISAVDLDKVVMINTIQNNKKKNVLSNEDLSFQEERRKRKVRRLDFEER